MNRFLIFLVFCLFFMNMVFISALNRSSYSSDNFSAKGRMFQPIPTGYGIPGKDSGTGKGMHNPGMDCGLCHRPDDPANNIKGKASNYVFTVSGTIYEDRAARRPLKGAEVILQDIEGNVLSMLTNEAGNFWSTAKIASNPYSVANHGGITEKLYSLNQDGTLATAAPDTDARTWQYKAWLRYENHVRTMVTIAPVGSATDGTARMSCSRHHSPFGSRGAIWALQKSTLSSYPAINLSFNKHILPIFVNKCVPCHIPGSALTRYVTKSDVDPNPTSIDFSYSQDFTSYDGSSFGSTFKKGIKDLTLLFASNPDSSPVLSHTLIQSNGSAIHAGGGFWNANDPDYLAIRQWIAEGAKNN
jgi:hypothetical protein